MSRTLSTWQQACATALCGSDERKVLGQIGRAVTALEMRFAESVNDPVSLEELQEILGSIRRLDRVIGDMLE